MTRLAVIAQNELRLRLRDPILWLLAIAAPLLVATLISLAFGDLVLGQTMPEARIAAGIVNADRGSSQGRLGEVFERAFLPDDDTPALRPRSVQALPADLHFPLFTVRPIADEAEARRLVAGGKLSAALIIPADFSQALADEQATVSVLVSGQEPALGLAFASAVETVAQMIALGEVTIRTTVTSLIGDAQTRAQLTAGALDDALADLALAAIRPEANPIQIHHLPPVNPPASIRLTHYLAATIAITILGLTALLTCAAIFQERAQWTLQRAFMTPTPAWAILIGKTAGACATGLVQVTVLIGGLALLERLLSHGPAAAPRLDPLGLGLLVAAAVVATIGYSTAVAGLTHSFTEALYLGGVLLIVTGLLGGVFFPTELLPDAIQTVARGTYQFWAMDGYLRLARGEAVTSLWTNLAALLIFGLVTIAWGHHLIWRRIEAV